MSNKRKCNGNLIIQKQSFSEKIENNQTIHYIKVIGATIVGIITILGTIFTIFDLRVYPSTSCLLKTDIDEKYILRSQHDEEMQKYILKISIYEQDIEELKRELENQDYHSDLIKRYDALVKERKDFENELNNLINFSTGIKNENLKFSQNPKKEELLRKIQTRDEQIKMLLEKIK